MHLLDYGNSFVFARLRSTQGLRTEKSHESISQVLQLCQEKKTSSVQTLLHNYKHAWDCVINVNETLFSLLLFPKKIKREKLLFPVCERCLIRHKGLKFSTCIIGIICIHYDAFWCIVCFNMLCTLRQCLEWHLVSPSTSSCVFLLHT